ncbi:DUF6174 domain-containing protein [Photobacterium kasasachensis]|uniref:DUF6174 domain-containing protein n=1 Tax=Photobacterium kasasachensis TaxID=2910240 RepID=UPI003D1242F0
MKRITASLIWLLLLGCNSSGSNHQESKSDISLSKWNEASVSSYSFHYEERGFSPLKGLWEIQVQDSKVIYVNYIGDQNPIALLDLESAPSIDTLYKKLAACEANSSCTIVELDFDDKYSFPNNYYQTTGEEGSGFALTNFVVR